jgi:hypothetical protein
VVDERAEVLVPVRAFFEPGPALTVAGHDRHVLEVAFSAFIAYRAVVGVVQHEPLDHALSESLRFGVVHRYAHAFCHRRHAGHDDLAAHVLLVLELLHRALAASAYGVQSRVPAEVRQVEAQGEAGLEEVLAGLDLVGFIVDVDCDHKKPLPRIRTDQNPDKGG